MCCSASNCLHIFCCCVHYWILILMCYYQIECMGMFMFSYNFWCLLSALRYDQFWRTFHVHWEECIFVQILGEIFCRHWLVPFDLWYDLLLEFLYWFFVCITYLLMISVLKSSTTTMLESVYAVWYFRVCLMILGLLTVSAYRLIIVISL
jgi:hypothetical protein